MKPVLWHNGSDITYIPSLSLFIVLLVALYSLGFLGGSMVEESSCNAGHLTEPEVLIPGVGKMPWRRKSQPTLVYLPGGSHEQRRLAGYDLRGHKESDIT